MRKERLKPYATAGFAGILGLTILSGCTGGGNPDAGVNRGPSPAVAPVNPRGPEAACRNSIYRYEVLGTLILSQSQEDTVLKGQLPEGLEPLKKTAAEATLFRYVLDASKPPALDQMYALSMASGKIMKELGMPNADAPHAIAFVVDEEVREQARDMGMGDGGFDVRPGEIAIQIGKDADTQCRDGSPLPLPGTSSSDIAIQPGRAV